MLKTFIFAFAGTGLMLSSTAAFARDDTPALAAAPVSALAPKLQTKIRYCLAAPVMTGTLVPNRTCKPLDQWRVDGIDPLKS